MERSEGTLAGFGGLELFYRVVRPAGAPRACAVYVHGIGDHGGRHPNLVEALVVAGNALVMPDMRGHGRSPGRRGHIDSFADFREDLARVLELAASLAPGAPLFVIGHSLGGLVVLDTALRRPQGLSGVVAMSPALSVEGVPRWKVAASRILDRIAPRLTMKVGLDSGGVSRDPAIKAADDSDPLCHGVATVRLAVEVQQAIAWVADHAAELRVPLLVLHGADDTVTPAPSSRAFYERVIAADKTRIEYPGGYHELDNDYAKAEALRDINAWIAARA